MKLQFTTYSLPPNGGYIALASVLIIAAVVLLIVVTTSMLSISEAQLSLSEVRKSKSVNFVESCVEEALITLNETGTVPSSVTLPDGSCSITDLSTVGSTWTFTTTGELETHTKSIQVSATRDSTITITSWKEL